MNIEALASFELGDMLVDYFRDSEKGTVQFSICPQAKQAERPVHRAFLPEDRPEYGPDVPAYALEPLVQLSVAELPLGGNRLNSRSLADSPAVTELVYESQSVQQADGQTTIETILSHPRGFQVVHVLRHRAGESALTVSTRFENTSKQAWTLQLLSSFSLGGVTPFDEGEAIERMALHRFRSQWGAEGRHSVEDFEALHFERSWSGGGHPVETFGHTGSQPVTGYFPFVALQDKVAEVYWAAQLKLPGSWQIEVHRRDDFTSLRGGLADRARGHWKKRIEAGQSFESPEVWLTTCVSASIGEVTQRLTAMQAPDWSQRSKREASMPVIFNEWCSNWGRTSHDKVMALAQRVKAIGIEYFVIDGGWAQGPAEVWMQNHGDWMVNTEKFPDMRQTCQDLKAMGYVPGVWFEFEVCSRDTLGLEMSVHLLSRDGEVLQIGSRCFWDFRDPWVIQYLSEKVIDFLKAHGFGYLKVDYNETLGIGVDSEDGLGEGLRQHLVGVQSFFQKIRSEVPDIVIENCASGGHRLEPAMMALADMASFSDAHMNTSIPIIARNVQHLILPSQSQIWAVLMGAESDRRLTYSLTACFYGRMCLSGQVHELNDAQLVVVKSAVDLYRAVSPIIKEGRSHFYEDMGPSYRDPKGWIAVLREGTGAAAGQLLVVAHAFENAPSDPITLPLPQGEWSVVDTLGLDAEDVSLASHQLQMRFEGDFSGAVLFLQQVEVAQ